MIEMVLHAPAMATEMTVEVGPARIAHGKGETEAPLRILRQAMGLLVGVLLQPVFRAAEKFVGRHQVDTGIGRQLGALYHWLLHGEDRGVLQLALASAAYQLKGLADELVLAFAAGAVLD